MAINDNTAKWRVKKLGNIIGSNGYWQPNEEVKVGTIRFPMGEDNIGYVLECVEAGTTGEEQPTLIGEELANYAEVGRVGQVRVIFNLAEKDVDEVMAMGITYSRLTYPELWEWAGKRAGLVISEEEWQVKFAETNGKFVPYYSSGDGSSTFRTPLLGAYLKGAETSSEVGKWLDAGLPNIYGYLRIRSAGTIGDYHTVTEGSGAFEVQQGDSIAKIDVSDTPTFTADDVRLNASRYNPLYGNSDTVTPETMTGVWVIKAVGVVVDSGETDIAQVLTATEQVQERVSAVEDWTNNSANYSSMPSNNYIDIAYDNFQPNVEEWYDIYYTAPTNGWVCLRAYADSNESARSVIDILNEQTMFKTTEITSGFGWGERAVYLPVSKGDVVIIGLYNMKSIQNCRFIYAESEV